MSHAPSDLKRLSDFLDSRFKAPGGFRFGWDAILGLIPGVGDFLTTAFSLYIISRAAMLGCPPSVLVRMGLNVLVENLVDLIPLFGNLFDFVWKSNNRNLRLLESYLARPQATARSSQALLWLTFITVIAVVVGALVAGFALLKALFDYFAATQGL